VCSRPFARLLKLLATPADSAECYLEKAKCVKITDSAGLELVCPLAEEQLVPILARHLQGCDTFLMQMLHNTNRLKKRE